ncbi:LuxR C-terminal-related transcriptional regulator [Sphingoaurantiacus capsulatus]|uniref:LuxR C-terminal-related transcriptional regulator n=1 Tax=Sphingoaurantiacus capsulatus TaxID=1771310 RepID=A0ABV7X7F4_9SPHN
MNGGAADQPDAAAGLGDDALALAFLRQAPVAPDIEALVALFGDLTARHGFSYFFAAYVASPGRPVEPAVLFGRPPIPSSANYVEQKLAANDAVIQQVFASPVPFTWGEIEARPLPPVQRRLFENARSNGFHDALVVPAHGANGDIWAVILLSPAPIRLTPGARATLVAAAGLFATTGATLAKLHTEPAVSPLTKREAQCLGWAARGKSDWEIAQILGIGDKTVNMHIDGARRKLGVQSRSQAAITAWRRGWLVEHPD